MVREPRNAEGECSQPAWSKQAKNQYGKYKICDERFCSYGLPGLVALISRIGFDRKWVATVGIKGKSPTRPDPVGVNTTEVWDTRRKNHEAKSKTCSTRLFQEAFHVPHRKHGASDQGQCKSTKM